MTTTNYAAGAAGILAKLEADLADSAKKQIATLVALDGSGLRAQSRTGLGLIQAVQRAQSGTLLGDSSRSVMMAAISGQAEQMARKAAGLI